ncbi:MAG: hypothetical protein PHD53_00160 [Methylococcales bacterium]|nr:hypothetical protein [Methylococcales bacterium]
MTVKNNITFVYPNRTREIRRNNSGTITGLHKCNFTENVNLPLSNILTDVIPEKARMDFASPSLKKCSFAISLPNIPYREIGCVAVASHNLSIVGKLRISIFNEPPIGYAVTSAVAAGGNIATFTFVAGDKPTSLANGTKLKLFACSSDQNDRHTETIIYATVTGYNTGTGVATCTTTGGSLPTNLDTVSYANWFVGYASGNVGKNESLLLNIPAWVQAWQRIHLPESPDLTWFSREFMTGTVEEAQRLDYTALSLNFMTRKEGDGLAPVGTHVRIDLDDSQTTQTYSDGTTNPSYQPFIEVGYVMFGQTFTAENNPEYGAIKHGIEDPSDYQESDGGQEYWHEKQKRRTVSVSFNLLDKTEAIGKVHEMQRLQGKSRPVIYSFTNRDFDEFHYAQSFIGRNVTLDPIGQPDYGKYDANINLKEMI